MKVVKARPSFHCWWIWHPHMLIFNRSSVFAPILITTCEALISTWCHQDCWRTTPLLFCSSPFCRRECWCSVRVRVSFTMALKFLMPGHWVKDRNSNFDLVMFFFLTGWPSWLGDTPPSSGVRNVTIDAGMWKQQCRLFPKETDSHCQPCHATPLVWPTREQEFSYHFPLFAPTLTLWPKCHLVTAVVVFWLISAQGSQKVLYLRLTFFKGTNQVAIVIFSDPCCLKNNQSAGFIAFSLSTSTFFLL